MLYLTLRQYEYVVAVAHAGSMNAAADLLNVSQPALSVAIQTVENHLGKALFIRQKGSPIRPTSFAKEFIPQLEVLLNGAKRLENGQFAKDHVLSRLRIGCFTDLAPLWLAPILKQLKRELPQTEVIPRVAGFEDLASELREGALDLAITYDLGLDARFKRDVLCHVSPSAFFAENNDLAANKHVRLDQLARLPLILFEEGLSIRQMLSLFAKNKSRPKIEHRVGSLEVMRSFAGNEEGVGISYAKPPGNMSYDGKIVIRVPISDEEAREPIVVAYLKETLNAPPIPKVLAILERLGRELGADGR